MNNSIFDQRESSLNECFRQSIVRNWEYEALCDYCGQSYTYQDVACHIMSLHLFFSEAGISKGDKIAICANNQSRWAIVFLATITYGAVVVPILYDFCQEQIHSIVNHSDAKLLFVTEKKWWKDMDIKSMPNVLGVLNISNFQFLATRSKELYLSYSNAIYYFKKNYPGGLNREDVCVHKDLPDELAVINYTSGTTSNPKGVMIPYRALLSNAKFAYEIYGPHSEERDRIVSMLPLAHTYGMSFEFIYEFISNIEIVFLTKVPSPSVLKKVFSEIKPVAMVCVPLIIEKIVNRLILPKLENPIIKKCIDKPVIGNMIKRYIRKRLQGFLGGHVYEVIIGGSSINYKVEKFLKDIKFNYTVGYGTTECAPIIAYEDWHDFKIGSCGKCVERMTLKIDCEDPITIPGEILVKGTNLMLGYYKNNEATTAVFDSDGWYHTGDMGTIDSDGNLFIKGRCKNMLLGSNGQNIYPEEIEDKLNTMPLVMESIVVKRGDNLYGLVYPRYDVVKYLTLSNEDLSIIMESNRKQLNDSLPVYERLVGIEIQEKEFEKTPKKSIKRFLYC